MHVLESARSRLEALKELKIYTDVPLAPYTRFGIGGPALLFVDTADVNSFSEALRIVRELAAPRLVIGGGTNLIVSDAGFEGVVLRFTGARIQRDGTLLRVESGAVLQDVVDASIAFGLKGMETMTGIPGYLGGAVYGNAGAYGQSIQERVESVRHTDGERITTFRNEDCRFRYRDSIFKDQKDWIILSTELRFHEGETEELANIAKNIRTIRDEKYPPSMKCAGSIFKNILFADLPSRVQAEVPPEKIREGKVPSAWFLEQTGVKGLRRGDIQVAEYHANLIYNDGGAIASDLVAVIDELKSRVRDRFGFELEEEVQYVGFEYAGARA